MIELVELNETHFELIFNWRNDPKIYQYLLNPAPVEWDSHVKWGYKVISSDRVFFYVGYDNERPIGTVRFDILEDEKQTAEVGIYVDPNLQSKGIGSKLLLAAEKTFKKQTGIDRIKALVLKENKASYRMFEKNGYQDKYIILYKDI